MSAPALAPQPLPPRANLPRARKAAIIVRFLLAEGANLPLKSMPADLQARLTAEIGAMRYVDGPTLRAVVAEFLGELEQAGIGFPGGLDEALRLLEGHISDEAAAGLRAARAGGPPSPWARIAKMDSDALLPLLQAESTEVAAVLLSKLSTARAAELLGQLPGERARRIACAVSQTGRVSPETVEMIGQTLSEQLDTAPKGAFETPAAERVGAILNLAPASTRNSVLEGLEQDDRTFAEDVRRVIFTFEDIPARLNTRDVPALTRNVAGETLVTALAGAMGTAQPTADFILENMSRRLADQLRDDIADRAAPSPKEAEAAMNEIVTAIRALEESGEIALVQPEEG